MGIGNSETTDHGGLAIHPLQRSRGSFTKYAIKNFMLCLGSPQSHFLVSHSSHCAQHFNEVFVAHNYGVGKTSEVGV